MVFFFQVDIPGDVPFFGGDHILVFQCPEHNDANSFVPEHNDANSPPDGPQLPVKFWENLPNPYDRIFWSILIQQDGAATEAFDPYLQSRTLTVERTVEVLDEYGWGSPGFKIGGSPSWAQEPESYRCQCGAALVFLCQVPESFGFDKRIDAEVQPFSYSDTKYVLFLGNEIYILACPAHCQTRAAWPVNQN